MKFTPKDVFAGVFAGITIEGIVVLALDEMAVPAELTTVLGLSRGVALSRQVETLNGRKAAAK